jgi:hypothetical protein
MANLHVEHKFFGVGMPSSVSESRRSQPPRE